MSNQFFELLKSEHKEINKVLNLIDKTKKKDTEERENLFNEFKRLIKPHMEGEEKYFYPKLYNKEDVSFDAKESDEEHHAARNILKELEGMKPGDERWGPKIHVLKEMISHHIEEEEDDLFKEAKKQLNDNQFDEILNNFKKNREQMEKKL